MNIQAKPSDFLGEGQCFGGQEIKFKRQKEREILGNTLVLKSVLLFSPLV